MRNYKTIFTCLILSTMINFLLFLVATILFLILWPIWFIWSLIDGIFHPGKLHSKASRIFVATAIAIDELANVMCRAMFNELLITKDWYKFGVIGETISSCLWKNQEAKTLKTIWKWLVGLLNFIQKNHCINSIDKNI